MTVPRRVRLSPRLLRSVYAIAWALAAMNAVMAVWLACDTTVGMDFLPLRHAGQALLHGHSVYSDPTFVYPPAAAPLFLPLAGGSTSLASVVWTVVLVLCLLGAMLVAARAARGAYRGAAIPFVVLCTATATSEGLYLGNLTLLLVPVAVAAVVAFRHERWTLGCALLAASLLVKPLLLPLLLVPAARRRWRALARTLGPAAAVLALAMVLVPGGSRVDRYVAYVVSGTNLHGALSTRNLSLAGLGRVQGWPEATVLAGRLAVLLVCGWVLVCAARRWSAAAAAPLALVVFLGSLLAGSIAEEHFLAVVLALVLYRVLAEPSVRVVACYLPCIALMWLDGTHFVPGLAGTFGQNWWVAAEVAALLAAVADARRTMAVSPVVAVDIDVIDTESWLPGRPRPCVDHAGSHADDPAAGPASKDGRAPVGLADGGAPAVRSGEDRSPVHGGGVVPAAPALARR